MYKESVEWYFKRFQRYAEKRYPLIKFELDAYRPDYKILYKLTDDNGNDYSTRFAAREFKIFLDGMCKAWDLEYKND